MIEVNFNKGKHVYTLNDGTILPSTSEILNATGISQYYKSSSQAMVRGTIIHKMTELYDKNDLGEYEHEYEPYLNSWIKFRKDYNIDHFHVIEKPLASSLGFATTPDRYSNGLLIDIKTGGIYPSYAIQTAAHSIVIKENFKIDVKERLIVQLTPTGYKITKYEDVNDFEVFISALNVYKWKWRQGNTKPPS